MFWERAENLEMFINLIEGIFFLEEASLPFTH